VSELLESGIIIESTSPYNNPLVLVRKKNGKLRMCVDFRELNAITKREFYPIPNAQEIFDRLSGKKFFSTIDLSKGYYQIKLDPSSQSKTAFSTSTGHYQFTRLPFGLTSAPTSFQSVLEKILVKEKQTKCAVYIDDVIVFGADKKQHDANLLDVLQTLKRAGVKLSREKFDFCKNSVKYLGHIISEKGIETDPEKLKAVKNWPRPQTVKELNSFLGFANYYRRFVRSFSEIAHALEAAVRKDKQSQKLKLQWNAPLEQSFVKLKEALSSSSVLHTPIPSETFLLDVDASKMSIGAVLSQVDSNGVEKPIHFASNKLSKAEQNYCTTRRELLAVVRYVKFFHHYLVGRKFQIRTDHKSLSWLLKWKTPSTSQYFRWIATLQEYDFEIIHRKGNLHTNADALSRNKYCRQCKSDHICFLENEKKNSSNAKINKEEIRKIVSDTHRFFAHTGATNLYAHLSKFHLSGNLRKLCKEVCSKCLICLKRKATKSVKLEPNSLMAKEIWEKVFVDVAGPFPPKNSFRYVLVIIDSFSNYVSIVPLKTLQGSEISRAIEDNWISYFGAPSQLHCDNATYFVGSEMNNLCQNFQIRLTHSSPYYPKGNGKVERMMRTLKDMIFCVMNEMKCSWVESISRVQTTLRGIICDKFGIVWKTNATW